MRSEKLIFHIDVNSAFLSWSALERLRGQPGSLDLRTVPSAVGGDEESRHGVVLAKSTPAKKYGITTGDALMVIKARTGKELQQESLWQPHVGNVRG